MESPLAVQERFRSNDLELLETGQFSDAEVGVNQRVWKVHKGILCPRSGYFRKAFSNQSTTEETADFTAFGFGIYEDKAELILEFIYAGSIKDISSRTMADCVELALLGRKFQVTGMIRYAEDNLWKKLSAHLQEAMTLSAEAETGLELGLVPKASIDGNVFHENFTDAVVMAYGTFKPQNIPLNPCQPILADFVWAARGRLLGKPFIEVLNMNYPRFGSHVLTTLNKGPQTRFLKFSGRPSSTFCTKCAQDEADGSGEAIQVLVPAGRR
ncbi:hypothetical protein KVR01_012126 [Diaporthe batatas]|uniref:uncharacterized protein n=1 Tax=Diaporthe batatas TaxID=748121 RepID=UPI001D0505F0|nr:uncharacterized protein KVR01_012126 [Diaporthe batatas]KAG8158365.1 hypothetical protein KVR01_012126 [Diaporthe batatas]